MTPWLSIVGVGEEGLGGLPPAVRALVDNAEVIVGGERHLAMVPNGSAERLTWESPLSATVDAIAQRRGRRVAVLATGDPMFYGIGVTLARRFPRDELAIVPNVGAVAHVCARLGWPEAEVETVTLHGRPLELLNYHVLPGARLVILSEDAKTPAQVAARLTECGFGPSHVTVFEHLGGESERRIDSAAAEWRGDTADLNTIAVDCVAGPDAVVRARVPGLPDSAFENDGQLTKREVRASTLSLLAPVPRALLWDVGAGSGSISIEWLRAERTAEAVAVEREPDRAQRIARNALALGVPRLKVATGAAPAALENLPQPDAVFVGGAVSKREVLETAFAALSPGGRFVANAVTVEGEAALAAFRDRHGGEMNRIAAARLETIGPAHGWRALRPVTQLLTVKRS